MIPRQSLKLIFRRRPFSTSSSGGTPLDHQILELNQELESVFGPCDVNSTQLPFTTSRDQAPHADPTPANANGHRPSIGQSSSLHGLSHVDRYGKASMVNISEKASSKRVAVASGKVILGRTAFALVSANQIEKGDVLTVAKIAGICGAKQTGLLIPLCHNIVISNVQVNLELNEEENAVNITAQVTAVGATGVEMEALTAVSVAALTVYDMCKAVSKGVVIGSIQLESKSGGKSGDWCRSNDSSD